jgi:hypothetical protein
VDRINMVYIDELKASLRSKCWPYDQACHMFADTDAELHLFAARLGLRRAWFQDHKRLRHYDLTKGKRAKAVRMGAREVDFRFVGERMRGTPQAALPRQRRLIEPFRVW